MAIYSIKVLINGFLGKLGYTPIQTKKKYYGDMDKDFFPIYTRSKKYTMTSIERMYSMYMATKYIVDNKIEGDIVECGVWRGGSTMVCALTLKKLNSKNKGLYLYDTYTGMSEPTEKDIKTGSKTKASSKWGGMNKKGYNEWCYASIEEVKHNLYSTGYPKNKLFFIKGKVEETIPKNIPEKIAILRLDTDWYESTYHEMVHLFPRLVQNGVLIIDDYGEWKGAREAIDLYIKEKNIKILLNRVDNTGRVAIKQ